MDKLSPIERMGTEVRGVRYDVARRTGQLHMPDGCCCDMQACIDLFEGIELRRSRGVEQLGSGHRSEKHSTGSVSISTRCGIPSLV